MSDKLFKFQTETQEDYQCGDNALQHIIGKTQSPNGKADILLPEGGKVVDIVKDFKWTKTKRGSEGREGTPTLELEEFYVTVPAFFTNLDVAKQLLTTGGAAVGGLVEGITDTAGFGSSVTTLLKDAGSSVSGGMQKILDGAREMFEEEELKLPQHLKAYEKLYGVKRSGFKYKVPYLEDEYKSLTNTWGEGSAKAIDAMLGNQVDNLSSFFKLFSPGVGIDYARSYTYDSSGPNHTLSFFLDNTADASYESDIPLYEKHYRLIYLLMYQNLPNKVNRVTVVPPVIYAAKLPGVFSYRWSYMSNIRVSMLGVRRTKKIRNFLNNKDNATVEAIIPEGFQVSFTLQSMFADTKNLFYDSVDSAVTVTEEE